MTTGLSTFDTTVQKTNLLLKDIMEELGWDNRHKAYLALRAVLHTLRDRLTLEEAADLGAQLPLLVRGAYYEGWNPSRNPVKFHREDFLACVEAYFPEEPVDAKVVSRAVFKALSRQIAEGEIADIRDILPKDMKQLWES